MSKISDEIRERIDDEDLYPGQIAWLRLIADRIDNEMVEPPKDVDGVPIHVGDTVYGCSSGMKMTVYELRMRGDGWVITTNAGFATDTSIFTHKRPDGLERIADELDDFADANYASGLLKQGVKDFAERIRKLAKEHAE